MVKPLLLVLMEVSLMCLVLTLVMMFVFSLVNYSWNSYGFGSNFILIPSGSSMLVEGILHFQITIQNKQIVGAKPKLSSINGFNSGLDFTYFLEGESQIKYGIEVLGFGNTLNFYTPSNILVDHNDNTTEFAGFVKYKHVGTRLLLEPSVRYHSYTSLGESSFEPRLGLKYNLTENLRFKSAGGVFSQNLIAVNTGREVVNLFQGFISSTTNLPDELNGEDRTSFLREQNMLLLV